MGSNPTVPTNFQMKKKIKRKRKPTSAQIEKRKKANARRFILSSLKKGDLLGLMGWDEELN